MTRLILCLILFSAFPLQAALYKYTNAAGETVYTDQAPHDGARAMKLPPLQTTTAIKVPKKKPPIKQDTNDYKAKTTTQYQRFSIVQPANGSSIRDNAGNLQIRLAIKPALNVAEGHRIDYLLDGKRIKRGSKFTQITLKNMDRGEHRIKAVLKNKQGKPIKSSPWVKFTLLRYSRLHNKAP